jgi:HSP20 family molecular chaperone IbpA
MNNKFMTMNPDVKIYEEEDCVRIVADKIVFDAEDLIIKHHIPNVDTSLTYDSTS